MIKTASLIFFLIQFSVIAAFGSSSIARSKRFSLSSGIGYSEYDGQTSIGKIGAVIPIQESGDLIFDFGIFRESNDVWVGLSELGYQYWLTEPERGIRLTLGIGATSVKFQDGFRPYGFARVGDSFKLFDKFDLVYSPYVEASLHSLNDIGFELQLLTFTFGW